MVMEARALREPSAEPVSNRCSALEPIRHLERVPSRAEVMTLRLLIDFRPTLQRFTRGHLRIHVS
jgi:hypothetical protein